MTEYVQAIACYVIYTGRHLVLIMNNIDFIGFIIKTAIWIKTVNEKIMLNLYIYIYIQCNSYYIIDMKLLTHRRHFHILQPSVWLMPQ